MVAFLSDDVKYPPQTTYLCHFPFLSFLQLSLSFFFNLPPLPLIFFLALTLTLYFFLSHAHRSTGRSERFSIVPGRHSRLKRRHPYRWLDSQAWWSRLVQRSYTSQEAPLKVFKTRQFSLKQKHFSSPPPLLLLLPSLSLPLSPSLPPQHSHHIRNDCFCCQFLKIIFSLSLSLPPNLKLFPNHKQFFFYNNFFFFEKIQTKKYIIFFKTFCIKSRKQTNFLNSYLNNKKYIFSIFLYYLKYIAKIIISYTFACVLWPILKDIFTFLRNQFKS